MTKLNDLQLVLLSSAAQRDDGSLLPPPEHLADQMVRIRKVIPPLIKHALVEEVANSDPCKMWRVDGDRGFALGITNAGRASIGVLANDETAELLDGPAAAAASTPIVMPEDQQRDDPTAVSIPLAAAPEPASKIDRVLGMLRSDQGASLSELVAATNWLPHSARAALTGLRKKGHAIDRRKVDEVTRYFLDADAQSAAA
ncbi:MAG: DUF3489 domain-containing protein [Alphaproteobacteria bacterium]|nr:DUF3489 domain-containing protein [Alphaproteobacteria bacterium]MBU0794246.1 DUF3489 domain-containing protein [Alphaproteobacteria bacterium]MBU0876594.1 DUF3489 domain-containing protein [Alphaproteobacteria bacterium]MBU1769295.1 DUF3489 domain-containing protein [Alphaproteobacteria bacterium]